MEKEEKKNEKKEREGKGYRFRALHEDAREKVCAVEVTLSRGCITLASAHSCLIKGAWIIFDVGSRARCKSALVLLKELAREKIKMNLIFRFLMLSVARRYVRTKFA